VTGAEYWLPLICASVVALAVILYVILDGFDLGIGILFCWLRAEPDRDQMLNSVAPFWDGNETWLVLGGNGLFVAFPLAYAIIMPALYLPLTAMLLALVFRGLSFEFRWIAKPSHAFWDRAFCIGSIVATACQGLMLGSLITGIRTDGHRFAGGVFDWVSPFSLLCGLGLLVGYAFLGACWLVMKASDDTEQRARRLARPLFVVFFAFIGAVSIWTPIALPRIAERWFSWPAFAWLAPIPLATAALGVWCWRGINGRHPTQAFYSAVGLFVLSFAGLVVSTMPYLVPPSLTIWDAAASPESQGFLLIGSAVLLPLILGYTAFVYRTFRGKIRLGAEGYHS